MKRYNEFSAGLIPLRYTIYENRKKGLTLKGILFLVSILIFIILTGLLISFAGKFGLIVGLIIGIVFGMLGKHTWGLKKFGFIEFTDLALIVKRLDQSETILFSEIKRIEYKVSIATKSGTPITFNLKIIMKTKPDLNLHVSGSAELEDRPKHFYSTPPFIIETMELLKKNNAVNTYYDRT